MHQVDGVGMEVMLDTGSSTGLTLNGRRVGEASPREGTLLIVLLLCSQAHRPGVNGERTCSNLTTAHRSTAGYEVDADPLPVMVKATDGSVSGGGQVHGTPLPESVRPVDGARQDRGEAVWEESKGPPPSVLREGKCSLKQRESV